MTQWINVPVAHTWHSLGLNPRTYTMEGENQFPQVVYWPPRAHLLIEINQKKNVQIIILEIHEVFTKCIYSNRHHLD